MGYLLSIDLLKGIGILLVIFGHCIYLWGDTSQYLHGFHVQLFFFISGYLFHDAPFLKFFAKKIKRLLVPYFVYGLLICSICPFLFRNFVVKDFLKGLFSYNNVPDLYIAGALWFLTALFFSNIIFFLGYKIFKKYLVGVLIILIVAFELHYKYKLPLSLDSAIYMLPTFYAGYLFSCLKIKLNARKKLMISIYFLVLTFLSIYYNGMTIVRTNEYSNYYIFCFNSIIASIAYFLLCDALSGVKQLKFLAFFGKNSLEFLCVHQVFLNYFMKNLKIQNSFYLFLLTLIYSTIAVFIIRYVKMLFLNIKKRMVKNV